MGVYNHYLSLAAAWEVEGLRAIDAEGWCHPDPSSVHLVSNPGYWYLWSTGVVY